MPMCNPLSLSVGRTYNLPLIEQAKVTACHFHNYVMSDCNTHLTSRHSPLRARCNKLLCCDLLYGEAHVARN